MKYILYNHVGSANHGCEALVRTIAGIFGEKNTVLLSEAPEEEELYGVSQIIDVRPALIRNKNIIDFISAYAKLKLKNDYFPLDVLTYKKAIRQINGKKDVLISIGGDIYCYDNYPKYILLHRYAKKYIKKSILLGCSIECDLLKNEALMKDLKSYDMISARESITYNAVVNAGIKNVIYCPDTAFVLQPEVTCLPNEFIPGKTVGFNISPLIMNKAKKGELLLDNYRRAIEYLLENTAYAVALIPHVAWKNNNDSEPLYDLYQQYKESGRICIISDLPAPKIKFCISQCKYFIGARTHASIAAYSTGVPTLVLGYSVKSRGIAKDLFGTDENFVIDYKSVNDEKAILNGLLWIMKNEMTIKNVLEEKQREYTAKIKQLKRNIENGM